MYEPSKSGPLRASQSMKLDTTLKRQTLNSRAREVGVSLDHWFPIGWSDRLKKGQVKKQTIWNRDFAVYRGQGGQVYAMDNHCLHKGVELSLGDVEGDKLVCAYHGWKFNGSGQCVEIPYLNDSEQLPRQCLKSLPVVERYNLIWIFPGDPALGDEEAIPSVPEFDDPDWLVVEIPAFFNVHFSMVNENPLDVFHGHLHRDLQGWYLPELMELNRDEDSVVARYDVSFNNGWLPRLLGLSQSKDPIVKRQIEVGYHYPHCRNTMPGKSNYYFMRQPEGEQKTRSYALLCIKIRLPAWLVRMTRRMLSKVLARFLVKPFLDQDIEVMESEQRNAIKNQDQRFVEINPVIAAAQLLTVKKYDAFVARRNAR